jgi:hypothetical protein
MSGYINDAFRRKGMSASDWGRQTVEYHPALVASMVLLVAGSSVSTVGGNRANSHD